MGDVMVDVSAAASAMRTAGDVHGEVRVHPGGAGPNAAVWAASAGARVRLIGRVGGDPIGRVLSAALADRGVDAALTIDPDARTGAMLVLAEGKRGAMVADRGANAHLSPADLPKELGAPAVLVSGYLLFHPRSEPAVVEALGRARAEWTAVDAASPALIEEYGAERFIEATAAANVLLANDLEASALAGDEPGAWKRLTTMYEHVFVKRGPDGASYLSGGTALDQGVESRGDPVDETGAGDAFDGVLLAALARGSSIRDAMQAACSAGTRCAMSPDPWPGRQPPT